MHDDPSRTSPIGLATFATEFFECSLAADDKLGEKRGFELLAPIPVMYLIGHSIELILKSYLLHSGVSLRDLRKNYGHDLEKCLTDSLKMGLGEYVKFDKTEMSAFTVLNELYLNKQLNYSVTGAKKYPVFGQIEGVCRKLLSVIRPIVGHRPYA